MKRVYLYLIFASLIFTAQATGKNLLTAKISQSTVTNPDNAVYILSDAQIKVRECVYVELYTKHRR